MYIAERKFNPVRIVEIEGEPWLVGKDVAEILGYERATKAILDHVDEEDKDESPIRDSIGRMQKTPIINESDLYSLVLSSKLPSAKKFKCWVTSEVLPSIRKHGGYIAGQETLSDHVDEDDKGVMKYDTPTYIKGREYYSYAYVCRNTAIFVCK